MIQRIQSIYLLLAAIVVGLLFFFPIADFVNDAGKFYLFRYRGLYEVIEGKEKLVSLTIPLAIILMVNMVLPLINIFFYKKRGFQMKLCIFSIILLFSSVGLIAYYAAASFKNIEANVNYQVFASMPIIALILNVMAYSAIRKDEKLIKSIDRIR
jgi:hypothetical protein